MVPMHGSRRLETGAIRRRAARVPRRRAALCAIALAAAAHAQAQAPASGRAAAPIDLTGYWVSLITQEWPERMLTPPTGDYRYIPLNEAGRAEAQRWNPGNDEQGGNACRGYAAPAVMRLPGRLHIVWADEQTLRVDIDTGTQTRLFHFGEPDALGPPTRQGHSVARWTLDGSALRVDTSHLRPGYLQKNGVPFSGDTFMSEYFNLVSAGGVDYLLVQIFVDDPTYLNEHWVRTVAFRREPDGEGWNPTPCSAY